MAEPQNSQSPLLNLSMELLQLITKQLRDDRYAIFSTRLTCKTLEASIFDRFAQRFFETYSYCIFQESSWLRLQDFLARSPRLVSKVRSVELTTSFFGDTYHSGIQLAPEEKSTNQFAIAQEFAGDAYEDQRILTLHEKPLPSAALFNSVLTDLKTKCPEVRLSLDALENSLSEAPVHVDVLDATMRAGITLDTLAVSGACLYKLISHESLHAQRFLTSSRSLLSFSFSTHEGHEIRTRGSHPESTDETVCRLLRDLMQAVPYLRHFAIDTGEFPRHSSHARKQQISEVLVGGLNHKLKYLQLTRVTVASANLLKALTNCGSGLRRVDLESVKLTDIGGRDWLDVLWTLTTMPNLCVLILFKLLQKQDDYTPSMHVDLANLAHGQTLTTACTHRGIPLPFVTFGNRVEVSAGLQKLLRRRLKHP